MRMDEFSDIFKVSSVYMAAVIGAGFASGREIVQFFSGYNHGGFYGIILAGVLFALIGAIVLDRVYTGRIRNYDEFIFPMLGWFMGWVVQVVVTVFLMCLFCIMIAGGGTILYQNLGIPYIYGVVLMAIICLAAMASDIKGITAVNTVLVPVLVAGMVLVGAYIIYTRDTSVFNYAGILSAITNNWVVSAIIYVSYNSIMSIVILCTLLPMLKSRKVGIAGGLLGGLILCGIAFLINIALMTFYPWALSEELPVLSVIKRFSAEIGVVYTILLWTAMVLSAVNSGYCFVERCTSKIRINKSVFIVLFCIACIPLSTASFSGLIASIYPVFGYLGLFIILAILVDWVKDLV